VVKPKTGCGKHPRARNVDRASGGSLGLEWYKIPQGAIKDLVDSMPRRVREVLKAEGRVQQVT